MPGKGQCKLTPDELVQRVAAYFEDCAATKVEAVIGKRVVEVSRPPTMIGLAIWLDMTQDTLYRYLNGDYRAYGDAGQIDNEARQHVSEIITRARDKIIRDAYEGATLGRYNERITTLRLGRMGERQTEPEQSMTIKVETGGHTSVDDLSV